MLLRRYFPFPVRRGLVPPWELENAVISGAAVVRRNRPEEKPQVPGAYPSLSFLCLQGRKGFTGSLYDAGLEGVSGFTTQFLLAV